MYFLLSRLSSDVSSVKVLSTPCPPGLCFLPIELSVYPSVAFLPHHLFLPYYNCFLSHSYPIYLGCRGALTCGHVSFMLVSLPHNTVPGTGLSDAE